MSHHVYTTRGLVLRLRSSRESDRTAFIYTRELGLVSAAARGARTPLSKLSPSLLELALVRVSLVRGRHSWRVTTVSLIRDLASELRERRSSLIALSRVTSLLGKLVRGEERHAELYDELERATLVLLDGVGEEDVDAWELYTVARMLHRLGYLSEEALPGSVIETRERRSALVRLINTSIKESGL